MSLPEKSFPRGTIEFVKARITCDVVLDTQPVAIAISRDDSRPWQAAEWTEQAGTTRWCRTTEPVTFDPTAYTPRRPFTVYVKVTDDPEIPILVAGTITVI